MKTIMHLADVHYSKEGQDLALASLECALAAGIQRRVDAWVFAGDLFDRGVANSAASGFPRLVNVLQRMLDVAPILSIEGTVTHDVPGSYAVLCELKAKHRFINLRPESPEIVAGILFMGFPEAGKEWLLASTESMSAEESTRKLIEGTRSILLGFGAVRASHADLPAVLVMHGPVKGSSLENRTVTDDGVGREDLLLVDFDYGALGHVHLEQKIEGVEAYYPGPAYHTDWGHLGQAGFNLVEIPDAGTAGYWPVSVTRVDYPHPRRVKFTLPWPEPAGDVEGVQAWVCIKATKEQAAKIDTVAVLEAYREQGALEGSRVTVELLPTETVRAAEITEKRALRDKVLVYAEASAGPSTSYVPDVAASILEKADQLEREAEERGAAAGMHFRLRRLRLRGAVGIWKGLRQDELDINLDKYDPGLIALIGVNGAGKSTLIENMHPYPCMLTRDGKLQDHFRLRDSARELWFVDERSGTEYRALMEIDGANVTGAVKYHLFRGDVMEPGFDPIWQPVTNGRREDYEEQIGRLIGSLPLFLRSAFVSQRATKRNPDLSDATEWQRKAIFRELAGLDYIQAYSDSAKARAVALEGQLTVGRGQVAVIERAVAGEEDVQTSIAESERDVKTADIRIANLTMQGKALKEETDRLAKLVAEQDAFGKEIHDAANQAQTKIAGAELAREKVEKLQEALAYQPAAQEQIATHGKLKAEEAVENERLSGINKERARLLSAHADAVTAHRDLAQRLQAAKTKVATAEAARKGDRNVLTAQIQQAAAGRKTISGCPKCGYIDPQIIKERAEADVRADTWKTKASQVDRELQDLARHVKEADANLIALLEPMKPTLPAADEREITHIRSALSDIDITAARATLEIAAKAEQEIATLAAQIATLDADAAALTSQVEAKRSQLDSEIAPAHAEALRKLDAARQAFTEAKEARATAAAKLEAAQKQLASITKQKCELEELRAVLAKMEAEAAEWRYLEQATGPDGIQAFELDAMGPGISEVANRLLSAAYGSRFSIELRTTRIAGKGSKTRRVEDFAIIVVDNELLTEQPIETLSGGESVWIKRALYDAFALIRDKTTGIRFLTVFADEADGALDPESRQKYFAMLEAAHHESGRRHTIVITHSPEVQEAIGQRIVMRRIES